MPHFCIFCNAASRPEVIPKPADTFYRVEHLLHIPNRPDHPDIKATTMTPIRIHDFTLSGHAHRVRLFCSLLGLPVELHPVDLRAGQQKSAAFLAMNPFGQVPVIEDGDVALGDSNAILLYLALKHDTARRWWPESALDQARVQQWLSAAAGPLANGPARMRVLKLFGGAPEARAADLAQQLFDSMERQLGLSRYLASQEHPTIADIAMYSYTARAGDGGLSLDAWPAVRRWLQDIEQLPGFTPMPEAPQRT